jgi:hypothetical protein
MSSTLPKEWKKWETNLGPLSEVMCDGTLCLDNTLMRNNFASSGDDIVLWVGMKMHCFERRSTTRMDVKPEEVGSCSMKSIEMEFHRRLGIRSRLSKL